ncbi:hypothetical protein CI105_08080 [Candidatus Izimaplasma bacterium ZiA1]|uniref:bifunctional diguanylate cyclase/phosphohydrolase n=1 Tax=Candidatus Izimoplasma sp. ZiA1 TaxID=2024899 RepID=UPI000BAA46FB|nr:hypothetical protein CI105_08080 [Candidatus Izimaplasma bacterium ZiA1]
MKNSKPITHKIDTLGLTGSGIGMWWIKYENGKYFHYQTESSCSIFNLDLNETPPVEIYGAKWKENFLNVTSKESTYKKAILDGQNQIMKLLQGEIDYCEYTIPWLDSNGNDILLTDKVYLIDKNFDGTAKTISGMTINESVRNAIRDRYHKIEEQNLQLINTERRVIDLADLLVWSIDFYDFPKGDYFLCNDAFTDKLDLKRKSNGYVPLTDLFKTTCDDDEGRISMELLKSNYKKTLNNEQDEYTAVLVKHKNIKTNEIFYLEHYTRVDERNEDGTLSKISGYLIDVTTSLKIKRENDALYMKNKELLLAQKLAVSSGEVMIWFLNNQTTPKEGYFYGNEIIFKKLGLKKHLDDYFLISEFNETIYLDDEEGKILYEELLRLDNDVVNNKLNSYSKKLVKHKNLITEEILYLEHNLIVEERNKDNTLKIRGGFITDITKETLYRKEIEFLVKHDLVTGLYNRNMFEEFTTSPNIPKNYSVFVIDIDGLKFINDAFGHTTGDKVIKILGSILIKTFSHDSTIYRIGGDEFTIVSSDVDQFSLDSRIKDLKSLIKSETTHTKYIFNISVGYELVLKNNMDFSSAFISAENIMYRRKLGVRSSRKSQTMETVLETLNTKTEETIAHCDRVGAFAVEIMKALGFTRTSDLDDIKLLCKVHDIGKITISEEILSKPEKLTDEEYTKIKSHSEAGFKIVKNIVESDLIANGVLYHHERYDGKGYPFGLKGKKIPLYARIISICDSYDVMIEGRPYQVKKTHDEAIEEILRCSGTQFDPKIVKVFIELFN